MQPHIDKKNRHLAQNPYKDWLLDPSSLTAKLKSHCRHTFEVRKLSQKWITPTPHEAKLLGLKPRQQAQLREVLLACDGVVWVYGRSLIPFSASKGKLAYLRRLNNRSLGAELFKHPALSRSHFDITKTPISLVPMNDHHHPTNIVLFTRRSCFTLFDKQLLVAETFLPPCLGKTYASNG